MEKLIDKVDAKLLGSRLAEARRARGMTQQKVADEMGMARTTIVAIEKGERRVTSKELLAFASLYGREVSRLVKPGTATSDFVPEFRKDWSEMLEKVPGAQAVSSELRAYADDYAELERLNGIERSDRDIPRYQIRGTSPEQAAEETAVSERNRLGIGDGPISNLRDRLEMDVGLRVFYFPMPSPISGVFAYNDELGGCVGINLNHPRDRRHWTLAHEYAHFLTTKYTPEVTMLKGGKRVSISERFADAFAENFLMPASGLNRRFTEVTRSSPNGTTMTEICQLADLYQVSVQALVLRLENLKRIAAGTWESLRYNGFKPREAQKVLGIEPDPPVRDELPKWYKKLAVAAYEQEKISEGQLARFLRSDRVTARTLVGALSTNYEERGGEYFSFELNFAQEVSGR